MNLITVTTFILVSIVFVAIPGPNIAVIVSTTLANGKAKGFMTMIGTSAAMAVQLLVAALATHWLLALFVEKLALLKWLGVVYLAFLGFKALINMADKNTKPDSKLVSFQRGFWVSLTNPKTILFFAAFLPQFVSSQEHYLLHILILSTLFWLIAVTIDSSYVLLADKASKYLSRFQQPKLLNGLTGTLYLSASAALGMSQK